MTMAAGTVLWIALYAIKSHKNDHVERSTARSTKLGNYLRQRDTRNRRTHEVMLNFNPNNRTSGIAFGR